MNQEGKRRRITAIVILVLVVIVVLFLVFLKPRRLSSGSMTSSDIVLTNVQSVSENNTIDKFNFFTGSNVAQANLNTIGSTKITKSLLQETAYEEPDNASYNPVENRLLISTRYTGESPFIDLGKTQPAKYFALQKDAVAVKLFEPYPSRTVLDARQDGKVIYGLLFGRNNKYTLFSYSLITNKPTTLLELNTNQIVGITPSSVILRNQKGETTIFNKSDRKIQTLKTNGAVYTDSTTDTILESTIQKDPQKESSLKVFNTSGKSKKYTLDYPTVYISKGLVVNLNNSNNPSEIVTTDIATGEAKKFTITITNPRLEDQIKDVQVLQLNPLVLGAISSDNQLFLISEDTTLIKSIPDYSYKVIKTGTFGVVNILSQPTSNEAFLITTQGNFSQSKNILQATCGCDINQVNKIWLNKELATTIND